MYRRALLSVFLLAPSVALAASVEFVHVEFNPEGTDAKREWVRIKNVSGAQLDLSGWSLYENKVHHGLRPVSTSVLSPGSTAIIADDAHTYLNEYPGTDDVVFDSSFSLSNSGETLEIRDATKVTVATISYQGDTKPKSSGTPRVLTRATSTLAASTAQASSGPGLLPWFAALVALTGLSGYALIDLRRRRRAGSGYRIVAVEHEKR